MLLSPFTEEMTEVQRVSLTPGHIAGKWQSLISHPGFFVPAPVSVCCWLCRALHVAEGESLMLEPAPQERKGSTESRARWLGGGVGEEGVRSRRSTGRAGGALPTSSGRDPWGRGWRDRRPHVGALPLRPRHAGLQADPSRGTAAKDVGRLV